MHDRCRELHRCSQFMTWKGAYRPNQHSSFLVKNSDVLYSSPRYLITDEVILLNLISARCANRSRSSSTSSFDSGLISFPSTSSSGTASYSTSPSTSLSLIDSYGGVTFILLEPGAGM